MYSKRFEKETFKNDVKENVRTLYRKEIEEATPQQIFQAVSYAVKEAIVDDWLATQKTYEKEDPKTVYYMSMEFLMGRALGNIIINLAARKGDVEMGSVMIGQIAGMLNEIKPVQEIIDDIVNKLAKVMESTQNISK